MENFTINDKKYLVKWTHNSKDAKQRTTLCEIYEDCDNCESATPISYAYAILSKDDKNKFSKKFGRRLSFQRALLGPFNKEERTEIWDYAHAMFTTNLIEVKK